MRRRALTTLAAAAALGLPGAARAEAWPDRPVRLVVPFPPGSISDALARLVTERLATPLGQRFVIDNRGGAAGGIGTEHVARSDPDGYTFGLASSGTHAANLALYRNIAYDPVRDFTAVAGLVYSSLYVQKGWFGQVLVPLGIQGAYSRLAIVLVLTFIGLPFIVRTVQPVLADLEAEIEEAAACLGATRLQTFWRVLLPTLLPATVTGFALAFARGIGEYGSVVFVSGNMPFKTEIAPVLVVASLEAFQYADAAAIAVVMLVMSFSLLVAINLLERWTKRHGYV